MNKAQCVDLRQASAGPARSFGGTLRRAPGAILATLLRWQARAEERAALRALDERMLRDIGLTRAEAEREAALPFWRQS